MKTKWMSFTNRIMLLLAISFINFRALAEESAITTGVNETANTTSEWYASTWVWAIGAVIFIVIFAAIIRERDDRRSDA
jgi:hypothetical protein